jgi:hypothetical protein
MIGRTNLEMGVMMPLSEHEQRVLEQMELALSVEDPKLVSTLAGAGPGQLVRSRLALAVGLVILGIGTLLGGSSDQQNFGAEDGKTESPERALDLHPAARRALGSPRRAVVSAVDVFSFRQKCALRFVGSRSPL